MQLTRHTCSPDLTYRRDFHVARAARDRYQFEDNLFSVRGTVVLANFHAARLFAQRMNAGRDLIRQPEQTIKASQINAMGLIHELAHLMIVAYRRQQNPQALQRALDSLNEQIGGAGVAVTLSRFVQEYPPLDVYRGRQSVAAYLAGKTGEDSNREISLEELLLLWLNNSNPAFAPFNELFDDETLARETAYRPMIEGLRDFFAGEPGFGPGNQSLIDLLEAPFKASPTSLAGQLEYIREHWSFSLGESLFRLLAGLDMIKEEEKPVFFGPGPAQVIEFGGGAGGWDAEPEPERFSEDLDWMPKVVMLAKNAYVWLDQLSRKYGRHLTQLDQVPNEELDRLASGGFTGLWLIGLWERSTASRRIKQMMGNQDAVASAYSLYDYQIATDLGGYDAYKNLFDRAWRRGIRLASDMVPNHVGIDGKWVIEHPDWFVSLPYSPFPGYTFDGPDLSSDERVGIFIEDHYYDRADAAVVFKRLDRWTGDVRFIYHGNDGTSMPWNDTAQLNYLNAEVREAVIQTILHVARMFPIIRFDAAMTLAKKHYQRLWYPEPGSGGDIASRAEHAMTKADFDAVFPEEFWREVVDRVAAEAPNTLLLAEAFWLMEGYFVRTLGMHRVYNSAFMNMLKTEDNASYRQVIKNTVEFDPEILKRYVNFMNNPDEDTAVAQFGKDDKYFGVATLLATMPGLPMFGHGQIEGFTEKYGMEFRRAMWDESPDPWLVERHQREIFPLLHKRYLFAEVRDFLLYDFYSPDGSVNEDVFAYSNRSGHERGLVVYHNKFAEARGWIRTSAAFAVKDADGNKHLEQKNLGEGLGLKNDPTHFVLFRDHATNLEYLRNCRELHEQGLYIELGAFKYQVFLDFREIEENEWGHYGMLARTLAGRGVPSVDEAIREIVLAPVREPLRPLLSGATVKKLVDAALVEANDALDAALLDEIDEQVAEALAAIEAFLAEGEEKKEEEEQQEEECDAESVAAGLRQELEAILQLPALPERYPAAGLAGYEDAAAALAESLPLEPASWAVLLAWHFTHELGRLAAGPDLAGQQSLAWLDEWLLHRLIANGLRGPGLDDGAAGYAVETVRVLIAHERWFENRAGQPRTAAAVLNVLLKDAQVQRFIGVNRFEDVLWYNKERFEALCGWLLVLAAVDAIQTQAPIDVPRTVVNRHGVIETLLAAAEKSAYQVEKLVGNA